jgi:hypothetical protein
MKGFTLSSKPLLTCGLLTRASSSRYFRPAPSAPIDKKGDHTDNQPLAVSVQASPPIRLALESLWTVAPPSVGNTQDASGSLAGSLFRHMFVVSKLKNPLTQSSQSEDTKTTKC